MVRKFNQYPYHFIEYKAKDVRNQRSDLPDKVVIGTIINFREYLKSNAYPAHILFYVKINANTYQVKSSYDQYKKLKKLDIDAIFMDKEVTFDVIRYKDSIGLGNKKLSNSFIDRIISDYKRTQK